MTARSTWNSGGGSERKVVSRQHGKWLEKSRQFEVVMGHNPDFKDLLSALSDRKARF